MSSRPRRARSVAPSTRVRPPVPTMSALTIRGEAPRLSTWMPRKRPLTSPLELGARLRAGQLDRRPAVLGRDVVVGVLDRLQPRLRAGADVRVLDVLGPPAGGGEEEGDDRLARVGDDLPAGGGDGGVGRLGLRGHAAVDLRARVGVVLEARAGLRGGDRVGARGDGLGLERLGRPRRRRLARHHARDVVLERDRVDRVDAAEGVGPELEDAAVAADAAERDRAVGPETCSGDEKVAIRLPAADSRSTCVAPWRRTL